MARFVIFSQLQKIIVWNKFYINTVCKLNYLNFDIILGSSRPFESQRSLCMLGQRISQNHIFANPYFPKLYFPKPYQSVTFVKILTKWMSEYIRINKITRMNIQIYSYKFCWNERMSELVFVSKIARLFEYIRIFV